MKLRQLSIERLPGIDERFSLDAIGDGIQIITGPNAIGKSSLCRAIRALLWREYGPDSYMAASATFSIDNQPLHVERDGTSHRWKRDGVDTDAPVLPAAHLDGCFFMALRDLLEPSAQAGHDLAHQIRLQMSGGFDIAAVGDALFGAIGPHHGRREQQAFNEAERELSQAISRQVQLEREEMELSTSRLALEDAVNAGIRLKSLDDAIKLANLREQQQRVQAELEILSTAYPHLTGNELDDLTQREEELDSKRSQQRKLKGILETALQDSAGTRLDSPIDPTLLATWRQKTEDLAKLETQIDNSKESLAGLRNALAEAGQDIAVSDTGKTTIDIPGAAELFSFLREANHVRNQDEAVSERMNIIGAVVFNTDQRQRLDLVNAGIASLRSWLRAPEPAQETGLPSSKKRTILFWTAALFAAAGIVAAFLLEPIFAAAATAGLGIALTTWWLASVPASLQGRETAQHDFPTGIAPLAAWSIELVSTRLRELESEAAELKSVETQAGLAQAERTRLEALHTDLQEKLNNIRQRRKDLAEKLGLDQISPDAELVDTARAIDNLRTATQAECRCAGELAETTSRYQSRLSEFSAEIARYGEPESRDAAGARAAYDNLVKRSTSLHQARERETSARGEAGHLEQDVSRISKAITGIYHRCELDSGDRAGLIRLRDGHPHYRELSAAHGQQAVEIKLLAARLTAATEGELQKIDISRLEAEKRRLESTSSRQEEFRSHISKIEAEIGRARERNDVAQAIAGRDNRRSRLEDCRSDAILAATGHFLLDKVQREHESNQMPRVLERARELFARFTHHTYDLRVTPDSAGSFLATVASSGEALRPDQLSDGTRVQLILAARLAFAHQAEGSTRLPIFLDETLDQSDPSRFEAITRCLGQIADDDNRQIFYLTSDPGDAARIQRALNLEGCKPAQVIDLANIRGRTTSITDPLALRVEQPAEIPDPTGMTAEAFAAALGGVTILNPQRGSSAQHLFHVLWDDLALLHRMLGTRVETVGQWSLLSGNKAPVAARICADSRICAQLDDRIKLLDAFCRTWQEGRGRPVTRETIEASGAISERFLDPVVDIARELDGDAQRLVNITGTRRADERLSGFRTLAAEALQAYLVEHAYLDQRPVLNEADLTTRLLMTPAAGRLPDRVFADCVHRWWQLCGRYTSSDEQLL